MAATSATSWTGALSVGLAVASNPPVTVDAAYVSNAGALNRWDRGQHGEVLAQEWPSLPPDAPATACWLRGRFTTADGRVFDQVLLEEASGEVRLVVAGGGDEPPLRPVAPPAGRR